MGIATDLFLPIALAIISFGMGLSLTLGDFRRVVTHAGPAAVGLTSQLVLMPLLGFLLAWGFGLPPVMAVGLVILAVCPGGATSNFITYLARGDTALSVSLTAVSSVVTIFTIPLLVNFALFEFTDATESVPLPVARTIGQIFAITLVPLAIGMVVRARMPDRAARADRPVRILSLVVFGLVILGALLAERENLPRYFAEAGPVTLTLNLLAMGLGLLGARVMGLGRPQRTAITIEIGIQNGTLAIFIASTLLGSVALAIPAAIYSLIMFVTAGLFVFVVTRRAAAG